MDLLAILKQRADDQCELCGSIEDLHVYQVEPAEKAISECQLLGCGKCLSSLDNPINEDVDANHWRCLSQSMWSEYVSVQVVVWRVLEQLKTEGWAAELQSQMFFDDITMDWARSGLNSSGSSESEEIIKTVDSVGNTLEAGDTVTLIKDLDVKGGGFTAKRGTVVKKISLTDNPEHVEGRVEGQRIVLVAKFLKKSM